MRRTRLNRSLLLTAVCALALGVNACGGGGNATPQPTQPTLTQDNNGRITGTYSDSTFGSGQLDPAAVNTINAQGAIEIRVKQGPFNDWTFRGQMDQTARRITGGIFGSGFSGHPFTIDKQ